MSQIAVLMILVTETLHVRKLMVDFNATVMRVIKAMDMMVNVPILMNVQETMVVLLIKYV